MNRRQFLAAAAAGAGGLLAGGAVADTYTFEIVHDARRIPTLRERVRVAFLSDLHYGPFVRAGSVARWVDAAMDQSADLVVLGGDLVDRMPGGPIDGLVDELARLRAPLGVLAVRGNHERARFRRLEAFEEALGAAGIEILVNRGVSVREDLHVAGIDDYRTGTPHLGRALRDRPPGAACLLVSHNPDVLPEVPTDVALTLSGHTHGGQIRLPGIGAVFTSSRYGRRFLEGWVDGPALGYVSRGLGFGLVPLRLDCPAELTVLDLTP
jgi:uncharacterized protein